MFYEETEKYDVILRQGDIFKGLFSASIVFDRRDKSKSDTELPVDPSCPFSEYINIEQEQICLNLADNFLVLVTPCCSIKKDDGLLFCPIIRVPRQISAHPNLTSPLIINDKIPASVAKHPDEWEALTPEQQAIEDHKGIGYAFESFFIFEEDGNIFKTPVAINFSHIFSIKNRSFGTPPDKLMKYRVLQLSEDTREKFSNKISAYYLNKI